MLFESTVVAALAVVASAAPTIHYRHNMFYPRAQHGQFGKIGVPMSSLNGTNATTPTGPNTGFKQVVYWGQNIEQPLEDVCKDGVDTVVLSFVNLYGNNSVDGMPVSNPGWACWTNATNSADDAWSYDACTQIGKNVSTCQAAGKKVLMSVGGWVDTSTLGANGGKDLADGLWKQYGEGAAHPVLGGVSLDGFDFDIEHDNDDNKNIGYVETIKELRSKFATAKKDYIITGAPMCVPESKNVMSTMMKEAQFDELYFQYYNNAPCGANNPAGTAAAWDGWYSSLQNGASKGAKIFLGLMASTKAGMPEYYLEPAKMTSLVNQMKSHKGFAGVMLYDAATAMNNTSGGTDYIGHVNQALKGH